jgi:hypothetical protein
LYCVVLPRVSLYLPFLFAVSAWGSRPDHSNPMMHAMTSPESMKAAADRDAYAVSGPGDARSGGGAVGSVQSCKQCREIESGGPIENMEGFCSHQMYDSGN